MTEALEKIQKISGILTTKEVLYREWITRLRANKDKQARGAVETKNGAVCAVGLMYRILREHGITTRHGEIGYEIGVPENIITSVIVKNDREHWSFPQIAGYVEKVMALRRWRFKKMLGGIPPSLRN
jgi:hypothetical protein